MSKRERTTRDKKETKMTVKKMEWKTVLAKSDIFLPFGQKGRRSFPKKGCKVKQIEGVIWKISTLWKSCGYSCWRNECSVKTLFTFHWNFCVAHLKPQVLILYLCIYLMSFLVDLRIWWNGRNMLHNPVWYLRKMPRVLSRDILIIIDK